ncbi:MAG: DnaK suppressor protein [Blastocatellia bacterium]|jgi:DnaK suppressor protein|nr:DnaK suppressor protein [Blastocatellia bacterium]
MTQTELANFREVLKTKQSELTKARGLESIAIERSADVLEEADLKTSRELAIASLNRDSTVRRSVASALYRIQDGSFGTCVHCDNEIGRRRLEVLPWAPLCIACQEAADRGEESVLESIDPPFLGAA